MTNRFFKLLYVFAFIGLGLSLPIYILSSMDFDAIYMTTYKARCLSNNQYVVLQGSRDRQPYVFDKFSYNDPIIPELDVKKQLNFYCKYYDEIQPHISAYINAQTTKEEWDANLNFSNFKDSVNSNISSYTELYKLEKVDDFFQPYQFWSPLIDWFMGALFAFLLLQIIRMSYLYIVFGEIVWHPLKQSKNK